MFDVSWQITADTIMVVVIFTHSNYNMVELQIVLENLGMFSFIPAFCM